MVADDAEPGARLARLRRVLGNDGVRSDVALLLVGHGAESVELAGARLAELAVDGVALGTGARRPGTGRDPQPAVGAAVAKDPAAQSTVVPPDEQCEARVATLAGAHRSVRNPLLRRLNSLQVQQSIAPLPQTVLFPVIQ